MRISATNVRKKDGTKLVNGYKIALQKSVVEATGFHEGTELVPKFEDGRITLTETNRFIAERQTPGKLWCYSYTKIADNLYDTIHYVFKVPAKEAEEILEIWKDKILPRSMVTTSKRSGNMVLIWKEKNYEQDPNFK